MDLSDLRTRINAVDDELLGLLNERARLVSQVGELKTKQDVAFYVPSREQAVLERLLPGCGRPPAGQSPG